MTPGTGAAAEVRAELEATARTYLTNAKHHADDCPFCNGEIKALMQLADAYADAAAREHHRENGPYYVELDTSPPHAPLTARDLEEDARDHAAEDGDYDRCEPTL